MSAGTAADVEAFYEACFNPDAELVGVVEHRFDQLSDKWVRRSSELLAEHDGEPRFRVSVGEPLDHLEIELTASGGVGHAQFHVSGELAATAVFLRHSSVPKEWEHVEDMLESLEFVLWGALTMNRLHEHCDISPPSLRLVLRRPLFSIIKFTEANFTQSDMHSATAFALNFAGAYLLRYAG